MKRVIIVFILFCTISLLWFYYTLNEVNKHSLVRVENIEQEEEFTVVIEQYLLEYERNYNFSMYEPTNGCYLGSYVLANKYIKFSSSEFDLLTGKEHPLSVTYLKAGKHLDKDWFIECTARLKTPYIILLPINTEEAFNELLIETTIRSISQYNMPYFIVLYPNPYELNVPSDKYKAFFREMSMKIKDISPKCAIVWSIDKENLNNSQQFYPGDEYVDWIGLNLRIDNIDEDYMKAIESFYILYEEKKPLIISELGIVNYSNINHKYYTKEANQVLNNIYSSLVNYPRIKGVNYINVNLNDPEVLPSVYSITEENALLETYKEKIATDYFITNVTKSSNLVGTDSFTYRVNILYYNDNYYIEDCNLIDSLILDLDKITKVFYKEKMYYLLKDIDTLAHYSIILNEEEKLIILR